MKREVTLPAVVDSIRIVTEFVDEQLESHACSLKLQMQIDIAVEEIFVNIAQYAYSEGTGKAKISLNMLESPSRFVITFTDTGIPYDPLAKPDPNIRLSAQERQIGGLGIYMVKKSMDDMRYERREGQNILTIVKNM